MTDVLEKLKELEWSGTREGPGSGPMDSGPGKKYPACPECGGVKPGIRSDFNDSAHGHRADCQLGAFLSPKKQALERQSKTSQAIKIQRDGLEKIAAELEELERQKKILWAAQQAKYNNIRWLQQVGNHPLPEEEG